MFCPECGTKNDQEFKFCPNCGHDLSIIIKKLESEAEIKSADDLSIAEELNDVSNEEEEEVTLSLSSEEFQKREKYIYYDKYKFEDFFGDLAANLKVYLKDNIPTEKVNLFVESYKSNHNDYNVRESCDWNYNTPYVFVEFSNSHQCKNGLLITVFEKQGLNGTGDAYLIINQDENFYCQRFPIFTENFLEAGSKLVVRFMDPENPDFFDEYPETWLSAEFDFGNQNKVLTALLNLNAEFIKLWNLKDYTNYEEFFGDLTKSEEVFLTDTITPDILEPFTELIKDGFENEQEFDDNLYKVFYKDELPNGKNYGFLLTRDQDRDLLLYFLTTEGRTLRFYVDIIEKINIKNDYLNIKVDDDIYHINFPKTDASVKLVEFIMDNNALSEIDDNEENDNNPDFNDPLGLRT